MNFYLGCAIWAYKEWVGRLFPAGSRSSDFLQLYSRRFPTVEGNTTFYSIPEPQTLQRWVTETPSGFKFCLKLPREITHQGLLVPKIPEAIAFLKQMQLLGDRLGPYFAQLPPGYSPALQTDLIQFLQACVAENIELALEVRHPDWFRSPQARELNTILTDLQVGRVLLDTRPIYDCPDNPQLASERKKPQLPLQPITTANFSLIRYISHPTLEQNHSYFEEWSYQVQQWLDRGTTLYFFVHCPVEVHSPENARYFQQILEQQGVPVPPLAWNQIEHPPTQLSLF